MRDKAAASAHGGSTRGGSGSGSGGLAAGSGPQLAESARKSTRSSGIPVVGRMVEAIAGAKMNAKRNWGKL